MAVQAVKPESERIVRREKRMTVSAITTGASESPLRAMIYGVDGCGKTTFAAQAPSPVFIGPEDGIPPALRGKIARFPLPETWDDVLEAIEDLIVNETQYRTLAFDTADWLEPLVHQAVCRAAGVSDIEEVGGGFQKGYTKAVDLWRVFVGALERLRRARGMNIIILAHHKVSSFKNPSGADWLRYTLKLEPRAAGLLREWCDVVGFCDFETVAKVDKKKVRGISTGARILHTSWSAAWDAKSRYSIPEDLPLSWEAFYEAIQQGTADSAENLRSGIADMLTSDKVDETTRTKIQSAVKAAADDTDKLSQISNRLSALVNKD